MREPTREEWKDWAAVMATKERDEALSNWWHNLPSFGWGSGYREAAQLHQSIAKQYENQQAQAREFHISEEYLEGFSDEPG